MVCRQSNQIENAKEIPDDPLVEYGKNWIVQILKKPNMVLYWGR